MQKYNELMGRSFIYDFATTQTGGTGDTDKKVKINLDQPSFDETQRAKKNSAMLERNINLKGVLKTTTASASAYDVPKE